MLSGSFFDAMVAIAYIALTIFAWLPTLDPPEFKDPLWKRTLFLAMPIGLFSLSLLRFELEVCITVAVLAFMFAYRVTRFPPLRT